MFSGLKVKCLFRSLIANLSAANCYKSEHLKRPENWKLGTAIYLSRLPHSTLCLVVGHMSCWSPLCNLILFFFGNSWKGKIFLHCWVFPYRVPWIHYACCWTRSCKQQGKTCLVRSFSFVIIAFLSSVIWDMHVQVFMMNLSAPFICEFFKDVQEKALP